ncbi:MAG: zinc ribbon domain-containing protein [Methylocella sp.]
MPVYDYSCEECGPFAAFRPMAEYRDAYSCPNCGVEAPRAFLTAPAIAGMDAGLRVAHATNERSANEPRRSAGVRHGANCGCCGAGAKSARTKAAGSGAKTFPNSRPWMISH